MTLFIMNTRKKTLFLSFPAPLVSVMLAYSNDTVKKNKLYFYAHGFPSDTVAYRHKVNGSFLIQYLAEVFGSFSREDHIEELFTKVGFAQV